MFVPTAAAQSYPRFLVLEGVDGSGKSTQAVLLADWLREQGHTVVLTREPGGTVLAERLRALILDPDIPSSPRAELLMILAARSQHVTELILPALEAGHVVISDRFSLSSFAYQGFGRGLPLEEVRAADQVATGGVTPGISLVVDVPFPVVLERIGDRCDRFEGDHAFLQRVIDGYRALAHEDEAIRMVDGTQNIDAVRDAIRREVQAAINLS